MVIRVYWASVTSNRKIDGDQARLRNLIEGKKIESKWIDITQNRSVMDQMRAECSNPKALPPQIFNDEVYLGNVDDLNISIEEGRLMEWLRLDSSSTEEPRVEPTHNGTEQCCVADPSSEVDDEFDFPPPPPEIISQTIVSTAVHNFENAKIDGPNISRKTFELQCSKPGDNELTDEQTNKTDEERRRRILGLPPMEVHDVNGSSEGDVVQLDSAPKGKPLYEVENAA